MSDELLERDTQAAKDASAVMRVRTVLLERDEGTAEST
jgi:hypothetical protein